MYCFHQTFDIFLNISLGLVSDPTLCGLGLVLDSNLSELGLDSDWNELVSTTTLVHCFIYDSK